MKKYHEIYYESRMPTGWQAKVRKSAASSGITWYEIGNLTQGIPTNDVNAFIAFLQEVVADEALLRDLQSDNLRTE